MTKTGRRIIAYVATSADGFIARRDGSVDWLNRPRTAGDYGMGAFMKTIDAIIWGRNTYGEGTKQGSGGGGFGIKAQNYVFTHRPAPPAKGVTFVNEPVRDFAARLRAQPGKDIWMMGGGGIIASFLDEGEIDDFIIHVIPTLIGEGVPLIAPRHRNVPLRLESSRAFADGVVRLHYVVEKAAIRGPRSAIRRPHKH
jgi:dihydrofolate reductase